ncbi:hypothetical protein P175DRAFT_0309989 [Aspergillus ochraceoroseus IBT 24754]|uniref:Uncharacterized protein n=1 Tax=Aspergillus ochraceoroseus IBT 24754 TaxID=1392256 RepID=A0A2T5LTL9_9EURO|nr:uncharacterized protein P175DRAFT_0309989 [Aspergillus ochraceoroseus IBT 24754]PTU19634.1 hypothetical protein P175DRAFT_0309989 [Aspergillus ochraceoroseus IBT 24754]
MILISTDPDTTAPPHPSIWSKQIHGYFHLIESWAYDYALPDTGSLRALTPENKRHLLASVKGYVAQEQQHDFDALVARLPYPFRHTVPETFLAIYVIKDVLHRFWTGPFWCYLGARNPALLPVRGGGGGGSHKLQISFITSSPSPSLGHGDGDVDMQRSSFQGDGDDDGNAPKLEPPKINRLARSLVTNLLSSRTAHLLLKNQNTAADKTERYVSLVQIYGLRARHAMGMAYWRRKMEARALDGLACMLFDCSSAAAEMRVVDLQGEERESKGTEGGWKQVLLVTRPALYSYSRYPVPGEKILEGKAWVVVEEEDVSGTGSGSGIVKEMKEIKQVKKQGKKQVKKQGKKKALQQGVRPVLKKKKAPLRS